LPDKRTDADFLIARQSYCCRLLITRQAYSTAADLLITRQEDCCKLPDCQTSELQTEWLPDKHTAAD